MREKILTAVRNANCYYLERVLDRNMPDRHEQLKDLYDRHMALIADFCMDSYGGHGTLTTAIICGLHKILFPHDYRQTVTTPQGEVVYMVPGEYKSMNNQGISRVHPDRINVFIAPADVSEALETAVGLLNAALLEAITDQARRDAILFFIVDFLTIHPFGDANGRVACILTDLLLVKEGLAPIYFYLIKEKDLSTLYRGIELVRENRELTPLYELIERYNLAALA